MSDKGSTSKTVLKEKVWLGTYHTPINAAVHHDFYKIVLAVEGCIFTSVDVPTCTPPLGKKKTHKLKLNFALHELPELMAKAVKFSQLWNRHKQDAERYVFRAVEPEKVHELVALLIRDHCGQLQKHIASNDNVRSSLACRTLHQRVSAKRYLTLLAASVMCARVCKSLSPCDMSECAYVGLHAERNVVVQEGTMGTIERRSSRRRSQHLPMGEPDSPEAP